MIADLPWGRLGLTICYDLRFPALYRALAERRRFSRCLPRSRTDRRGALAYAVARPRHRERLLRVRGGAGRPAREQARDLWPFADRRPLGRRFSRKAASNPVFSWAKIDPSKVETARKAVPSLQHGRRFGIADPKAGPEYLHLVRGSA